MVAAVGLAAGVVADSFEVVSVDWAVAGFTVSEWTFSAELGFESCAVFELPSERAFSVVNDAVIEMNKIALKITNRPAGMPARQLISRMKSLAACQDTIASLRKVSFLVEEVSFRVISNFGSWKSGKLASSASMSAYKSGFFAGKWATGRAALVLAREAKTALGGMIS